METVFDRLVAARRERRRLAAQLEQLDELLEAIEAEALETMVEAGLQSVRTADGATIYIEESIFARPAAGHEAELVDALATNGMADLVRPRVMPQTLSAVVREMIRTDGALPGWMEPWVAVHRQQKVRVRGA
jgi:hypothetical protein